MLNQELHTPKYVQVPVHPSAIARRRPLVVELDANRNRLRDLLIQELNTPLGSVPPASVVAGRRPLIIELDALRFPAPPSPAAIWETTPCENTLWTL